MRRVFSVIFILVLVVSSGIGCLASKPAAPAGPTDAARLTVLETWRGTIEAWQKDIAASVTDHTRAIDAKATKEYVDQKVSGVTTNTGYARSEVDAKITELQTQITALKTAQTATPNYPVNNQQPQQNVNTPQGTISYTIIYPTQAQPMSTIGAPGASVVMQMRIFSNVATSRYVSFTVTLTPYSGINQSITAFGGEMQAVSTQFGGVNPITFQKTNVGTPIISRVLFTPLSGGVINTAEYLLSTGQTLDVTLNITGLYSTPAGLWTATVAGADRAMY
jgi:hypothetical protein